VVYMRRRRRYWREEERRRRRFGAIGCLWMAFVAIVIILVLGFIFGGWRQGSKINQPGTAPQTAAQVQLTAARF
jgi:type VI protein secretion system component VasF